MNVTLPANGWGVAENLRDRADRLLQIGFGLFLCFKCAGRAERDRREYCPCPGAKIFGGEIFACNLAQILVYIL